MMRVRVEEIEGAQAGRQVVLEGPGEFLAGRASSAGIPALPIGVSDTLASRSHFVVAVGSDSCRIRDAGSANGTWLLGLLRERRVRRETALRPGDCVRAGATVLRFDFGPRHGPPLREAPRVTVGVTCASCGAPLVDAALPEDAELARSCDHLCDACARQRAGNGNAREIGEYLVLDLLGRGRMGAAWVVWSAGSRRLLALKESRPDAPSSPRSALAFLREVEAMRSVRHPNVVRLLAHGRAGEVHYFISELQRGGSVEALLAGTGGTLPAAHAVAIAREALRGLEAVHEAGFVHRDVKPSNILLSDLRAPVARIADFGLAKRFLGAGLSGITRPGDAAGTQGYMAPEQAVDFCQAGPRADLYAMGAVVYRMLTGSLPTDPASSRFLALTTRLPASPGLVAVVDRALRVQPRARWPSARSFREALEAAGAGVGGCP